MELDEQSRNFGPDKAPGRGPAMLLCTAAAIPAGAKCGALVGVGSGPLLGLFLYPFVAVVAIPFYALAGALLGALSAAIVGAVSAGARSVSVGRLAGVGASLALGIALISAAYLAPPRRPPFGPGQPINAAAGPEEEQRLERDYLAWMAEQDEGERGGFIIFIALPAMICALASAWIAGRRLRYRHPEMVGGPGWD
jgi:hypothetical protein